MKYKVGDKVTLTNGDTMTVYQINDTLKWYFMMEDPLNCYTDEMIECKVEEETKPKYEDEVNGEYYSTPKYLVRPSGYQFVDENGNVINARKVVLEKKKNNISLTQEQINIMVHESCALFCKHCGCGVPRDTCTSLGTCDEHDEYKKHIRLYLKEKLYGKDNNTCQ